MRVLFIVNPVAGKGHALKIVPSIKSTMESITDTQYEIVYSKEPWDAEKIARDYAEKGTDIVFAVGGDGTVNEVANGLVNTNTAMAIIPGGTGNDFIRSLGITGSPCEIIQRTLKGNRKKIDIGLINGRYFVNISSVGFDAEVAIAAQKAKKFFISGSAAYVAGLISVIFTSRPKAIKMKADNIEVSDSILLVAVANGKYYGGGMKAAPDAVIDDGLFDICFISHIAKIKMFFLFPLFMKGKHKIIREVKFYRASRVTIEAEKPIYINIDGEIIQDTNVTFELIKGGLAIAMPSQDL